MQFLQKYGHFGRSWERGAWRQLKKLSVVLCLMDHSESGDSILLFTLYDFELMLMLVEAADDTYSFSLFVYLIFGFSIHIQSCFIVLFNAHSFLIYRSCGLL